jgi:hypothetical protein
VIDEVLSDELVDEVQSAVVPYLFGDAPHQRLGILMLPGSAMIGLAPRGGWCLAPASERLSVQSNHLCHFGFGSPKAGFCVGGVANFGGMGSSVGGAALEGVAELHCDALSTRELVVVLQRCERVRRRLPAIEHPVINQLARQATRATPPTTPPASTAPQGNLGQHNGLPASIITTTLTELETAAGRGRTGGRTPLPCPT